MSEKEQQKALRKEKITKALAEARKEKTPGFRALAKKYGTSRKTLKRRFEKQKRAEKEGWRRGVPSKLSSTTLACFLMRNGSLSRQQRIDFANDLLKDEAIENGVDPKSIKPVSWRWIKDFEDQYKLDEITITEPLEPGRCTAYDMGDLQDWFNRLEETIKKFSIEPENLWNFSAFRLQTGYGMHRSIWTVSLSSSSNSLPLEDFEFDQGLTVVEAVSAAGKALNPTIILHGASVHKAWRAAATNTHELEFSFNGFPSHKTMPNWVANFKRQTEGQRKDKWSLVIGTGSVFDLDTPRIRDAESDRIIFLKVPAGARFTIPPLEIGPLEPYRRWQEDALERCGMGTPKGLSKVQFLKTVQNTRDRALTPINIKESFRMSGVWPLNRDIPLEYLFGPRREEWPVVEADDEEEDGDSSEEDSEGDEADSDGEDTDEAADEDKEKEAKEDKMETKKEVTSTS